MIFFFLPLFREGRIQCHDRMVPGRKRINNVQVATKVVLENIGHSPVPDTRNTQLKDKIHLTAVWEMEITAGEHQI